MSKKPRMADEIMKRRLDLQLDRELEDTFLASDALKITRTSHDASLHIVPSKKRGSDWL